MTRLRLSDAAPDHPAIVGLSDAAFALWVRAELYCARHKTGRRIPGASLPALLRRRSNAAALELVAARVLLWAEGDGYELADLGLVAVEEPAPELTAEEARREGWRHRQRDKRARDMSRRMSPDVTVTCHADVTPDGTHPRAIAGAGASDPDLSLGSEIPDQKKIPDPDPHFPRSPRAAKTPTGPTAEQRYRAAYEAGVRDASADPFALPAAKIGGVLGPVLRVHAVGPLGAPLEGPELDAWIRATVATWRRAVDPTYASGWLPHAFARWLNTRNAARPAIATSLQPTGGWKPSTPAEREERRKANGAT